MKKLASTLLLLLATVFGSFAQSGFDFILSPNISTVSVHNGKSIVPGQYLDSMKDIHSRRTSLSFEATYLYMVNRNSMLQIGLRYNNTGYKKSLTDLQFHDSIHPDIDRIQDLSQAAPKDAYVYYNVHYIELPIRYAIRVSKPSKAFEYGIFASFGLNAQYLLSDYVNIDLSGFTVEGQGSFNKMESYRTYTNFNLGPVLGVRGQYRLSKGFWITAKPELYLPFAPISNEDVKFRLYQFSANIGISYIFE